MSKQDDDATRSGQPAPHLRREVTRRGLITRELGQASRKAAQQLPGFAGLFGLAPRESKSQRAERLVRWLWQLLMGRDPKPEEGEASLQLVRSAQTPDEQGDALVDVLWALCQSREFEELNRPNRALVKGLYKIALDRDPTEHERDAALAILKEAEDAAARTAALEGLFTGLVRSAECVLRR